MEGSLSMQPGDVVSSGEERTEGTPPVMNPNWDYFTPALMDVWPKILDNMTDSKDFVSVMNSSPVFRSLLEKRKTSALLPLVFPILMKQDPYQLAPRDVFSCRLVSKNMKTSVDDILINSQNWLIREDAYVLLEHDVMQTFLDVTPGIKGNPFLGRHCELTLDDDVFRDSLEVLRRHGHELHKVFFSIKLFHSPERVMKMLKRALRHLPNLESLEVEFPEIEADDKDDWKNYRDRLPALKSLRKLELTCFIDDEIDEIELIPPPPSFLRPILLAYGNQLTSLSCESFVFRGNARKSISFTHLLHLEVSFPVTESSKARRLIFRNLAKLRCPQLESLTFTGAKMRLRAEMFVALNNFKSTLTKLRFGERLRENLKLFQMDPLDVQEFPKLACLTLCPVDAETPYRHLFRYMFPKLQELRIEAPDSLRFSAPLAPNENARRGHFIIFPNLTRITTIEKHYLGEEETVFNRPNNF